MSTATLEIPSGSTQLYFSWSDASEDMSSNCQSVVTGVPATVVPVTVATAVVARNGQGNSPMNQRRAQPVKVGSLLLQLLKRYGITDEEIAEGIAAYEAKRT